MILFEDPPLPFAVLDLVALDDLGTSSNGKTYDRSESSDDDDPDLAAYRYRTIASVAAPGYPRSEIHEPRGSGGTRQSEEGGEDMRIAPRVRRALRLEHIVSDALTAWLRHVEASHAASTYKSYKHHAHRHLIPTIGGLGLEQVTAHYVDVEILDRYRETPSAASHAVRVLSAAYTAWGRWQWVSHGYNPCRGVRLHSADGRDRLASDDELAASWGLLEHYQQSSTRCERDAADILALIALTGARKAVYERLVWSEVDLDGAALSLQAASGRKRLRRVILPLRAIEILRGRAECSGTHGRVFPKAWKVRRLWESIREEIGAPDLTVHDLRRTWSTLLGEAGIDAEDSAAAIGQKSVAVQRKHYRHLREPRLREIAELGAQQMSRKR